MNSAETVAAYNAGLGNIRICIETRLEEAGARIEGASIAHPAWPADGAPPEFLRMVIVPVGWPRIDVVFSSREIAACNWGVTSDDVSDKINYIVAEYRECKESLRATMYRPAFGTST